MRFAVHFTYPWLLFLLIPAAGLTVLLYLLQNKRYRRNRNRITSIVLHSIVMLLCVLTLSGMTFSYSVKNPGNELIVLVDVSDTAEESKARRDEFLDAVLTEGDYAGCKIGIVTFGFTQNYVSPLGEREDVSFEQYIVAEEPDTSATDIAAALLYARDLFEHPESGKILLISDGKQTDEQARSVIGSIVAQGIGIDTFCLDSSFEGDNVQVLGMGLPDYNVKPGTQGTIEVSVRSEIAIPAVTLRLYDNGKTAEGDTVTVDIVAGTNVVRFDHTFAEQGLHELRVEAEDPSDQLQSNNEYYSYLWMHSYTRVLILEQADQSAKLKGVLEEDPVGYEVKVINLNGEDEVPGSVDALRDYDQVILNNISSRDLEAFGLDEMLYDYVYRYGGGLFTTGGKDSEGEEPHAYDRSDMNNTLYQSMLPVQVIDYTPPVGVFVIIDVSGSMSETQNGRTKLEWAQNGAIACLDALTERDYIGVMTTSEDYGMVLDLTPRTQDGLIREKIDGMQYGGATAFSTAITRAASRLANLKNVDKRHIILVTDGVATNEGESAYLRAAEDAYNQQQVTVSVIGIGIGSSSAAGASMTKLAEECGHGRFHSLSDASRLLLEMQEELREDAIKDVVYQDFKPYVNNILSPLLDGVEFGAEFGEGRSVLNATLGGFFGVKSRNNTDIVLVGDYDVPLYAQWKFGEGTVGSFMCDVYSEWSAEFMESANGKRFLQNVVANIMPTDDVRASGIRLDLREENYLNRLSVYTTLEEGQTVRARLLDAAGSEVLSLGTVSEVQDGEMYVTVALNADNGFSRANFVLKKGGAYTLLAEKLDAEGNVVDSTSVRKSFAYSKEYDPEQEQDPVLFMSEIAERGGGLVIDEEEPWEVFSTFVTRIPKTFDPRLTFMIVSLVLFLLDIAVRKFKFKWPHELIREYKEKKAGKV